MPDKLNKSSQSTTALAVGEPSENRAKEVGLGVVKAAFGAIPYVGAAVNEALFETRSRIQQNRVNNLAKSLAIQVAALGEDKIDSKYLGTDEFSDVIADVVARTARARSENKRRLFCQILLGAMAGRRDTDFDTVFRELVAELSEDETQMLKHFTPAYKLSAQAKDWQQPFIAPLDYEQPELLGHPPLVTRQIIQNLIRKGLLFDDSHGRMSNPPYRIVMPTDLGAAFHDWLLALPELSKS